MVRDMSVEVRVRAFDALGMMKKVSDNVLLQSLSKKGLSITEAKHTIGQCTAEQLKKLELSAAGALVHGLEDEFYEVRRSACSSLQTLTIFSGKFADQALNLLMDLLNDDSVAVRLQALETMHHMATNDRLKVEKAHVHRFFSTLVYNDTMTRIAARKIIRLMKLHDLKMFTSFINQLIDNLERYPQDEADIFSVLFNVGRRHGKFAVRFIGLVSQKMEPPDEGKFGFNSGRVAAYLVLAISAALSDDELVNSIPPRIYSYAVTLLGRISHGLSEFMNQDTLLDYLLHCSRCTASSETEFKVDEPLLPKIKDNPSEIQSQKMHDEVTKYLELILAKVEDIWPLIKSGCTVEVLKTLRNIKGELLKISTSSPESAASLAFSLQYIRIMKLLAKVFLAERGYRSRQMGELHLVLRKLDRCLREMRYRFTGLSIEDKIQILELILVTCMLRLSNIEICCHHSTLKNMYTIISCIKEAIMEPSKFVTEVEKLLANIGTTSIDGPCCKKLLEFFSLKQFMLHGGLKHIKADLEVTNPENPVPFISGLPVGIILDISLYNVSSENRLWLTMTMDDESNQFVFLNLDQFGGCDEMWKFRYVVPFYRTPKVGCFRLRVSIGMECLFEDVRIVRGGCGGPRRELIYICKDVEVYLSVK